MKVRKEDFEVWDKHLDTDKSYKSLGDGRWYNDYMYQEALVQNGELSNVREPFMKWGDFFLGVMAGVFLILIILGQIFNTL